LASVAMGPGFRRDDVLGQCRATKARRCVGVVFGRACASYSP
jgi:hypothetical protein